MLLSWRFFLICVPFWELLYFCNMVLQCLQPNVQSKPQKEGSESELFWNLLGGKYEYPSQRISKNVESDPHLFSCTFSEGRSEETFSYLSKTFLFFSAGIITNILIACCSTINLSFLGPLDEWAIRKSKGWHGELLEFILLRLLFDLFFISRLFLFGLFSPLSFN